MVYRNIRFSGKVNRCLRRGWRMHGDLSGRVRAALRTVDLASVSLVDVDNHKTKATQIGNDEAGWLAVQLVARERGCSVNTLINSVVWAAYGARKADAGEGFAADVTQPASPVEMCLADV